VQLKAAHWRRRDQQQRLVGAVAGGADQLGDPVKARRANQPGGALVAVVATLGSGVQADGRRQGRRGEAPAVKAPQSLLEPAGRGVLVPIAAEVGFDRAGEVCAEQAGVVAQPWNTQNAANALATIRRPAALQATSSRQRLVRFQSSVTSWSSKTM
jgi:hypothetical protein